MSLAITFLAELWQFRFELQIGCKVESRMAGAGLDAADLERQRLVAGSVAVVPPPVANRVRDPKKLRSVMVGERRLRVQFRTRMEWTAVDTPASAHQWTLSPPKLSSGCFVRLWSISANIYFGQFLFWPVFLRPIPFWPILLLPFLLWPVLFYISYWAYLKMYGFIP